MESLKNKTVLILSISSAVLVLTAAVFLYAMDLKKVYEELKQPDRI